MSYADSQLAEEYQWGQEQLSHRNTNYTFYVIMQRYKERKIRNKTKSAAETRWANSQGNLSATFCDFMWDPCLLINYFHI